MQAAVAKKLRNDPNPHSVFDERVLFNGLDTLPKKKGMHGWDVTGILNNFVLMG